MGYEHVIKNVNERLISSLLPSAVDINQLKVACFEKTSRNVMARSSFKFLEDC